MRWILARSDGSQSVTLDQCPVYKPAEAAWRTDAMTFPDPTGEAWVLTSPTTMVVDVPTFMMRFQPDEEIAIRASEDAYVVLFRRRLDDPRVKNVNLAHPSVQGAVMYMALNVNPPLIAPARVAEILAPQPVE